MYKELVFENFPKAQKKQAEMAMLFGYWPEIFSVFKNGKTKFVIVLPKNLVPIQPMSNPGIVGILTSREAEQNLYRPIREGAKFSANLGKKGFGFLEKKLKKGGKIYG